MSGTSIQIKVVLLSASSMTVMAGALITPVLPDIGRHFSDWPDVWVKLIITLPALFIALFSPLMGWLADRYGRLPVLKTCLLIYALAGAAGGLVDTLGWMLLTRALLGIGVAGIMGIATTLIGDYFTGQARQRFMGLQGSFMALGGVIYINLGGGLALISWRAAFMVYLAGLLVWLLAWLYLREPARKTLSDPLTDSMNPPAFPWRQVLPVYALGFAAMSLFYMLPAQMPFLLVQRFDASSLQTAWVISSSTLAGALAGYLFGGFKNHLSHARIYALAFLLFATGYLLASLVPWYSLMLLAVMVSGFGAGMTFPAGNHWLLQLAPEAFRGRVMGGFASVFFTGQFLSPLLVAPVELRVGLTGAFQVAALLALVLSVLLLWRPPARASSAGDGQS
ncbi:MFS transporter [Marinospirillum alkaliphilum]|uniref:Predicted arabinose efflux permease, MFS family n=1 Tax=Marinospirillum alkaliphilum DSM 21637 TaxID=1122209 RepID=A0A1K1X6Y9_9GAMM|nr:MFS transporter [Marinospirillum alkaliphilum]SFX45311.1 Predicted arabinose efflux permease, MFS family [Marinospirillum alkaliphilum DSM 21637]